MRELSQDEVLKAISGGTSYSLVKQLQLGQITLNAFFSGVLQEFISSSQSTPFDYQDFIQDVFG